MRQLLLYICLLKICFVKNANNYCNATNNQLICDNFDDFGYLNFSEFTDTFTSINLMPSNKLTLNSSLNLDFLKIEDDFNLQLYNIKSFSMINPFALRQVNNGTLLLRNSSFDFTFNGQLIDNKLCNEINENVIFVSVFDGFNFKISLDEDITFSNETCPIHFKNINIKTFKATGLSDGNKLNFMDTNIQSNGLIENFEISISEIYLDSKLFHKEVFKLTKSLVIDQSTLLGIEPDLFKNFENLNQIELNLNNFKSFINSNSTWIGDLNYKQNSTQFLITLNDLQQDYIYPDDDLCLFKDFPHNKSVYPIIKTKSNLACSCTLIWLIQKRNVFSNTSSTANCFLNPQFDRLFSECNFELKLSKCSNKKCTFENSLINCTNFSSFSELDFTAINNTFQSVNLAPNELVYFDSKLDFQSVSFINNFSVELSNIKGFFMEANPFALRALNGGTLVLKNSYLDFYYEEKIIDNFTRCDYINRNDFFIAYFDVFKTVSLEDNIKYPNEFCPIQFKNAKIDTFSVSGLKSGNKLNFMDIPMNDSFSNLNSNVNNFKISFSEIFLNRKILHIEVFKNLKSLFIFGSSILAIEYDLFKNFNSLRNIELEMLNFGIFIKTDQSWMKYLNGNITVDLNNQNDLDNNKNNRMKLVLADLNLSYTYPEEDFCNFKDFPHNKLVFPVIVTKKNLVCSCTLMWLIKYKALYPDSSQQMNTSSVSDCLYSSNFSTFVSNCDFDAKLNVCNGITTSAVFTSNSISTSQTSTTTSSDINDSIYKELFISFVTISAILALALGLTIFIIIKYKILGKKSIEFNKFDNEMDNITQS